MSQTASATNLTKQAVVYRIPDMESVPVRREVSYHARGGEALTMDVYYPPKSNNDHPHPAVILVVGYPDQGFAAKVGCRFKEMASTISWAQLIAASGVAAITYTNREPIADLHALLEYLPQHAAALKLDTARIGLLANSGNVPLALSLLRKPAPTFLKCAALCYGPMLNLEGGNDIATLASQFGFAHPGGWKHVSELSPAIPLFVARAGQDQFALLKATLDRFVTQALASNLPITLANHATAPHAFDLFDDSDATRVIIRQLLSFLRFHLLTQP